MSHRSHSMRLQWLQLKDISWSSWHLGCLGCLGCLGSTDMSYEKSLSSQPCCLIRKSQVFASRDVPVDVHQLKRMYMCMYVYIYNIYIYNLQSNIDYVYPLGGHFCKFNHHLFHSYPAVQTGPSLLGLPGTSFITRMNLWSCWPQSQPAAE